MTALAVLIVGAAGATTSVLAGGTGKGGEAGSPLQAWGDNTYGEIGHGPRTEESDPVRSPVSVEGISCAVTAAVSFHDSYAVLGDGHVDAWGADGSQGGLGDGDPGFQEYSYKPVEVPGISNAVQIAAEIPDVYVLLSDGTVDAWGNSADGAFGLGASGPSSDDLPVTGIGHLSGVSQIATGGGAELALLSNGEVRSWGFNDDGQLGNDTEDTEVEPVAVGNEKDTAHLEHVKAVAEGVGYSLALMADGEVMAWGGSSTSGLGAGSLKTESELPVPVENVEGKGKPLQHVTAIAAGSSTAYALLEGGAMVAWGYNALGQLGNGKAEVVTAYHPVAVESLKEVVEIAATEGDGYARLANGTVWAWGNNTQGEVGNGSTTTPIPTPTQVTGLGSSTTRLADGAQGQPELALGAISTECGAGTGSTETTSTETKSTESTSSNPSGGGTASTSSTPTGTATTVTTVTAATEAATKLALQCSDRKLALTDVVEKNGRVLLDGAAVTSLAGKTVKILFDGHQQVASAKIGPQGQFSATAPLPPAKLRNSNSARYLAESDGLQSLNLKLTRRLILDPPTSSAGKVTLTGQVIPPLGKPVPVIDVQQQLTCASTSTVAKAKPSASGRFDIEVPAPAGALAVLYRLSTKVRENTSSRTLFPTDSLPEAVGLP
ncbi:MAG TPA: hypothetical protein VED41_02215 [Solirubrobacteraceae bacterium]|nr:hypothetical protein [Solirubrobacteraceae bacterium]